MKITEQIKQPILNNNTYTISNLPKGFYFIKLANANHPAYPYDATVQNITVPSTANYTITLDLSNPGNFSYRLKRN